MRGRYFLTLVWLFFRSPRLLLTTTGVLLTVALTTATFVVVNGFALSGGQLAERDLGTKEHTFAVPIRFGDRFTDPEAEALLNAVRGAGGVGPTLVITSFDVSPDSLPAQYSTGRVQLPTYREGPDLTKQFAASYKLLSGRWPTTAGEVVLSPALWERIGKPARFTAFSGAVDLKVAGVASPLFGEDSWRIIGAPGTWQSWPAERIRAGFPGAEGQAHLYWSGSVAPQAVAAAVAKVADTQKVVPDHTQVAPDQLMTGYQSRSQLMARDDIPLTEYLPLIHTYPSVLLTGLITVFTVNLNRRRLVGALRRLTAVGLQRRTVSGAMITALLTATTAAALIGLGLGLGIGIAARHWLIPAVSDHPVSPMPSPVDSSARSLIVTGLVCLIAGWASLRDSRSRGWGRRLAMLTGALPWALLRRISAVLLVTRAAAAASTGFPTLEQVSAATFQFVTGFLLLTPDLLRLSTHLLPTSNSVTLTARRLVESDRARHALAATTLACCISVPTAAATLRATEQRTEEAQNIARVPEGQLWVDSGNSTPQIALRVSDIVASTPGTERPAHLGIMTEPRFAVPGKGGAFGVLVLPTIDDLRAVTPDPPADAVNTLRQGGVIDWSGADAPQHFVTQTRDGLKRLTSELPTTTLPVDPSYQSAFAGAILQSTANRLKLPVQPDSLLVFSDLDEATIRAAVNRVTAEGINPKLVAYHVTPLRIKPPPEWYLATVGVALTGFGLLWAVQRGQARHLRDYAARLLAIGLHRGWSLRVLLVQALQSLLLGLLVGLPAGAIPIALVSANTPLGLVLDIPTGFIGTTIGLSLAAALAAVLLSLRALRPQATTSEAEGV